MRIGSAVFCMVCGVLCANAQPSTGSFNPGWFYFANTYVNYPLQPMRQDVTRGDANAFQIEGTSLDNAIADFIVSRNVAFVHGLAASTYVLSQMPASPGTSTEYIASEYQKLNALGGRTAAHRVWWNIMPEFDQSGGIWPARRTMDYSSRANAYASWRSSCLNNYPPLGEYLTIPLSQRSVGLLALNDYSFSTHYSYELGADMVVLERVNDELGDLQTGICFLRGAARQYDRPWGIDISTWRAATQSPTEYDDGLHQTGGWSSSYFRRHLYLAYMAGANLIQNEPSIRFKSGTMTALGYVIEEVSDFCLVRHRERGQTDVRTALLLDFTHGVEPKYGAYNQLDRVWYQNIPYSSGDYMVHAFLDMLFPGYWKSGTLPASAPQTPTAYREALVSGADSRPWEPMGESRWGDQFDVLLSNVSLETLRKYRNIVLTGGIVLDDRLKDALTTWVAEGGNLVINIRQTRAQDDSLLGVSRTGTTRQTSSARWLADSSTISEKSFTYEVVTPTSASVLAESGQHHPLVTRSSLGLGSVYLTTPLYLLDNGRTAILKTGQRLMGEILDSGALVSISGSAAIQFCVNRDSGRVIVTLVNNTGVDWVGTVTVIEPDADYSAAEWVSDTDLLVGKVNRRSAVHATIRAYDLGIIALTRATTDSSTEPGLEPHSFELDQNYPNPFNNTSTIRFHLESAMEVSLYIVDALGRRVITLVNGRMPAGSHAVVVDAGHLSTGAYFACLRRGASTLARKMLVQR